MIPQVGLSEKQKIIVYAGSGAIYVKASAGSGKTRVLTERLRYLLTQTKKEILALTFTNKAGEEIKERLSDVADINKKIFIGTFHGFCQSILENHGSLIGYVAMPHIFEAESDRLELIEQAINQTPSYAAVYKNKGKKEQRDFCYRALNFISKIKRELISESEIEKHTEDGNIVLLYRSYQDILRVQGAMDFDDLLLKVYSLFIDYPKVAALYRRSFFAICVDEAQDLNNAQYQFLKVLANGEFNNIMMVGDPNQSIFHFTGSSPNYMDKEFVKDFFPETIELMENYRSSIAVLKAAKKIIPDAESVERTAKEGVFSLYKTDNEHSEAKWITDKIKEIILLKNHDDIEGEIGFEKIAVLARNKYLFKPLEEALNNSGLPYYYKMAPGALRFESSLMQIFDLAFRIKLNTQDELHLKHLLYAVSLHAESPLTLSKIAGKIKNAEQKRVIELVISFSEDGNNFKNNLEAYKDQLFIDDEDEKNMLFNDIEELLKHWHNYAKETDNKSLHQFKNAMALGQTHPLSQHTGITLSTVHTLKGQEFDIVFIIGMDDETFPDYRAVRRGGIELLQEKNNLYVAFTRSKRWLCVTWPENRTMPWGDSRQRTVSRFLTNFEYKEIPAESKREIS